MTQVSDCRSNHHCYTNHPQITPSQPSHILPRDYLSFGMFFKQELFFLVTSHSFAVCCEQYVPKFKQVSHYMCSESPLTASPPPALCNHRLLPHLAVCAVLTHPTISYQPMANLKTDALRSLHFLLSGSHKRVRKDKTFLVSFSNFSLGSGVQTTSAERSGKANVEV